MKKAEAISQLVRFMGLYVCLTGQGPVCGRERERARMNTFKVRDVEGKKTPRIGIHI